MGGWLAVLFQVVTGLIPIAEDFFKDKPKSGADKKAMVIAGTKAIADGLVDSKTDTAPLEKPINDFIDIAAAALTKPSTPDTNTVSKQ